MPALQWLVARWRVAVGLLLVCCMWPARADDEAALQRGRALYEGGERLSLASASVPASQNEAATAPPCVTCHRPSGLGNFEGGLVVPPIAGPYLFRPLDSDTARFFRSSVRYRVRPAYDERSLASLLREGVAPDGVHMHAAMPRVRIADAQVADLAHYLRSMTLAPSPGLQANDIYLATVSTPDVEPARRDAMLATLERFVAQKNGQSRHEAQRSTQASHTREMVMYTKFRVWHLAHWALQGPPESWPQQLAAHQAAQPVFALVGGLGRADWAPVDAFCERERLPCLLPLVDAGAGGSRGFYSLHYQVGIDAETALAAQLLRTQGIAKVQLWSDDAAPALQARVRSALLGAGIAVQGDGDDAAAAVVSLLAPREHLLRLRSRLPGAAAVAWLPGTHGVGQAELDAATQGLAKGWVVTAMHSGRALDRQLARARVWMQQQGLQALPADVVASTLQAATVFGEGMAHLDFAFTREYLLELLEHSLENVIPWSPFPRLAIGPDQRVAVKQIRWAEVRDGRLRWNDDAVR